MDNARDHRTNYTAPAMPTEAELRAAMEQSDRDVAAGDTVPLEDVLAELDEIVAEIETRRQARSA